MNLSKPKKKSFIEEEKDETMVQIMTISLFIILLAFFILLNSIAVLDEKKKRIVVGSIIENFGGNNLDEPTTGNYPESLFNDGVSPIDFTGLFRGDKKQAKMVSIQTTAKHTILTIQDAALFQDYKTLLTPKGKRLLRKIAAIVKENHSTVEIGCHFDDVPAFDLLGMGIREFTALRSIGIIRYLIEKEKVTPTLLTAVGWGKNKPKAPNKTSATRKMNRRVDIIFKHEPQKSGGRGFFIFKDFFFNVDN